MIKLRYLVMVSVIFTASPVWGDASGLPHFPPESYNIQDFTVPGSATVQASLRMDSRYPESGIVDHYADGVSHHWLACRSTNPGWQLYIDTSDGQQKIVHQLIRYWVNEKDSKMLSIIVRHYSDGGAERCVPESNVQHAVVVVSVSLALNNEKRLLKLQCGGNIARWEAALPASCSFN